MAVNLEKLIVTLEARTAEYQRQLGQAQQQTNRQLAAIESRFAKLSNQVRGSTSTMAMGVTGALGSIGAALSVAAVVEYANAWTRVTRSLTAAQPVFGVSLRSAQDLTDLANDARVDLEAYSKLYIRTSAAIRDYGFEAGTAEKVTSTLAKALKLGGAAASEQASVLLQFSQALQKGKLDGDEFRSVMENAGIVQELLAKRLNVTKGRIVELAAAGKLQIPDLVGAMVDGAAQVDRIYRQMPQTIDEAFAVLRNNVVKFLGEADQANGASQALAAGIVKISQNLQLVSVAIGAVMGSATARMLAFAVATAGAANPVTLLAAAVGALSTAYAVYGDEVSISSDKTVTLKDSLQAFLEVAGDDAREIVNGLQGAISEFADANSDAAKSLREITTEGVKSFGTLVTQALLLQDKLSFGPSILDGLLKVNSVLERIDDRAQSISSARNFPDFGKIIRDADAGLLVSPPKGKPEGAKGTGSEKRSQFEREIDQIRKRTAALQAEAETIGATTVVQEKARAAAELRAAAVATAAKEGRTLTAAELQQVEKLADAYGVAAGQVQFLNALQSVEDDSRALQDEIDLMGLYGFELEKARIEQELLNAARRSGIEVTPALRDRITEQAEINAMQREHLRNTKEIQTASEDALKGFITDMREGVSATEALGNALNRLADKLIDMAINNLVQSALGGLTGGAATGGGGGGLISGLFRAFGLADGGLVRGPGTGRSDSIPARLSNGEFVVNADATRRHRDLLEAINQGRMPGFANGGLVSAAPPAMPSLSSPANAAAPSMNVTVAPQFNVQNGSPEGVDRMKGEIVPVVERIVRKEIGQVFDRQRRFTRSGI